jgi:serine/threonine protein kinase
MAKEIGEYLVDEENVLGQGSDGTVYLGKCKRSNQQVRLNPPQLTFAFINLPFLLRFCIVCMKVAVKRINKALLSERAKNHLATEIRVLKTLNHPNIIKLRDAFDDVRTQEIHLVMVGSCFLCPCAAYFHLTSFAAV